MAFGQLGLSALTLAETPFYTHCPEASGDHLAPPSDGVWCMVSRAGIGLCWGIA